MAQEINLEDGVDNFFTAKITGMLARRGYKPIVTEPWWKIGSRHDRLLLFGPAVCEMPFDDKCHYKGFPPEKDCERISCKAHYREVNLVVSHNQVYESWDWESGDPMYGLNEVLKAENYVPVLLKEHA